MVQGVIEQFNEIFSAIQIVFSDYKWDGEILEQSMVMRNSYIPFVGVRKDLSTIVVAYNTHASRPTLEILIKPEDASLVAYTLEGVDVQAADYSVRLLGSEDRIRSYFIVNLAED